MNPGHHGPQALQKQQMNARKNIPSVIGGAAVVAAVASV